MTLSFTDNRFELEKECTCTEWIESSGLSETELQKAVADIENVFSSKAVIKAKTFEFIASNARIAVDRYNIFQDKLQGCSIMAK